MNRITLAAAVAIALAASPAMAWDNTNNGSGPKQIVDGGPGAQSTATAASRSSSASRSTAVGIGGRGGNARGGNATATGGRVVVNNSTGGGGGGDYGYHDIPVSSAIAPSFYNGGNPCLGPAASAAGQAPVFGLSFGGQQMDEVCRARMLGEMDTAREVECQDSRSFRNAAYTVGRPCAADRNRWAEEHPVQPAPVKFVPSPWCAKATEIERRHNPGSCGG